MYKKKWDGRWQAPTVCRWRHILLVQVETTGSGILRNVRGANKGLTDGAFLVLLHSLSTQQLRRRRRRRWRRLAHTGLKGNYYQTARYHYRITILGRSLIVTRAKRTDNNNNNKELVCSPPAPSSILPIECGWVHGLYSVHHAKSNKEKKKKNEAAPWCRKSWITFASFAFKRVPKPHFKMGARECNVTSHELSSSLRWIRPFSDRKRPRITLPKSNSHTMWES